MPNWVENDLTITAKSKKAVADLQRFKELVYTKGKYKEGDANVDCPLDFEKIVPFPEEVYEEAKDREEIEELRKNGKKGEADKLEILYKLKEHKEFDWHSWNIINWGTKWNSRFWGSDYPQVGKNNLFYNFSTAWNPPFPIIFVASKLFPNLNFKLKYYEAGMGFCGMVEYKNGHQLKSTHRDNYRGGRGG
jgi:hypothetical protein